MSGTGMKLTPNLDKNSTRMLNLTVLQRVDQHIEEILITAAHVTFYEFNVQSSNWSRKDVEGPLFVVKRNTQPRFQFIVMNRRNEDNLVENILGDFEFEIQIPYLLYRNAAQEVNGIWFYNSRECQEVSNLFHRILSAYSKVHPNPKSSIKSDFEELEAVPTTGVIEGSLEPSFSGPGSAAVPTDSPFMNFFSNAMNLNHNVNVSPSPPLAPQVQSYPLPAPFTLPMNIGHNVHETPPDPTNGNNWMMTNLVKPSTFVSPPFSSPALLTPISLPMPNSSFQSHLNIPRPHGTALLQPFPPPTPSPSLTPAAPNYGPISRDKVHEALLMLVQDNQFIDMVSQALQKMHQS